MNHPAWILISLGVILSAVGVAWLLLPSLPWLGRLPGDLAIERPHVHVYFPLTTCLVLSALISGLLWLAKRFWP